MRLTINTYQTITIIIIVLYALTVIWGYLNYTIVNLLLLTTQTVVFCFFLPAFYMLITSLRKKAADSSFNMLLLNESCLVSKTDTQGKITFVNDKFCEVSQYLPQEILDQDHSIFMAGEPEKGFWDKMNSITVKHKQTWVDTVTDKKKDGTLFVVKRWIKAEFTIDGKHIGYTYVRHDITNEALSADKIDNQNKLMSHINYSIRHDLANTLRIYMPISLKTLTKKHPEDVKTINRVYKQMRRIYDGIYEFSNLTKPEGVIATDTYSLNEVLEEYFTEVVYKRNMEIDTNLKWDISPNMFCQAVDNLVRNGLRYNDSKQKLVRIYNENDKLIIEDNGRGLTPTQLKEFSKEWVRGDNKESGSGLGLTIVFKILEAHNLTLTCKKIESGTKMIISK